jgi:hypothetical protein
MALPLIDDDDEMADIIRAAHGTANQLCPNEWCYFIGGDDGPVKIGKADSVEGRIKELQIGSPVRLRILGFRDGGRYREKAYHLQFRKSRLHGEWFERTPALEAEIERLYR